MTTPGEEYAGAGLWSTTGKGPPSPPPGVSLNLADQRSVGQVSIPKPSSTAGRAQPKTPCPWTYLCRCHNCCVCCGYDFCERCCCPCTCCRCCYWLSMIIILFLLAVGLAVVVLWKLLHPKLPTYNVDNVKFSYSVTGAGATSVNSTSPPTSYILNANTVFVMETTNPNTAIGIYYDQITLNIKMFGMVIGNQIIPKFYDGYNVTKYINGNMTSGPLTLSTANQVALTAAVNAGNLPLNLKIDVKVRIGIGHWVTPQLKVELNCVVSIDPGASGSQITGMKCRFSFKL